MGRKPKATVEVKRGRKPAVAIEATTRKRGRKPAVAVEATPARNVEGKRGRKRKGILNVEEKARHGRKPKAVEEASTVEAEKSSPFSSRKKKSGATSVLVRRSGRLKEKIQDNIVELDVHVDPISSKLIRNSKLKLTEDYETLYIDSQKQVEVLTEDNYKQANELSYMHGKVDAYEYMIGYLKTLSNMTDADETNANAEPCLANPKYCVRRLKKCNF